MLICSCYQGNDLKANGCEEVRTGRGAGGRGTMGWTGRMGRTALPSRLSRRSRPYRLEFRERLEDLVVVRLVAGVVEDFGMADDAVLVDHERRPLGDALQPDHVGVVRAVRLDDFFVEITQQWEIQILIFLESRQCKEGVNADAVDLRMRVV